MYESTLALEDINLTIDHGAQVAVVGPNGAGKSTLFKSMVGLIPLQSGTIRIHGQPLGQHLDCIAYVPQREEIDWHFPVTVRDVIMMSRYGKFGWLSQPRKIDHTVVDRSLRQLGLHEIANHRIDELSGGQQQRVFLARALAQEPHILLMDEPFTGVDATTQEVTLELLKELGKKKVTTLVSTHDLNLASEKFEKVLLLNKKVIAFDIPSKVFTHNSIRSAFGDHLLFLDGAMIMEECCPPGKEGDLK
jgi:manganese/iron transport system ATP-binding protein